MIYNLILIRKYLNTESAVVIFKAYILSRIEYGALFCINARKSVLERLQKLVNKSLRICFKANFTVSSCHLHLNAQILPLRLQRKIATLKLIFLVNQRMMHKYQTHNTRQIILGRQTRHSLWNYVKCEFSKSEWYQKSVVYQGPKYWEILPTRLKSGSDILEFKKSIEDYYIVMFREENFV